MRDPFTGLPDPRNMRYSELRGMEDSLPDLTRNPDIRRYKESVRDERFFRDEEMAWAAQQNQQSAFNSGHGGVPKQGRKLTPQERELIAFVGIATTGVPLQAVEESDYGSHCKHCGVSPFSEGPHHDRSCSRWNPYLELDTKLAHKYKCTHCSARPMVAGFHHKASCDRGFPAVPAWDPSDGSYKYKHKCKHCSARPLSEGPHHDEGCERFSRVPMFHTDLAHDYYCRYCDARPFLAGPHHRTSCRRHEKEIPIPAIMLMK